MFPGGRETVVEGRDHEGLRLPRSFLNCASILKSSHPLAKLLHLILRSVLLWVRHGGWIHDRQD